MKKYYRLPQINNHTLCPGLHLIELSICIALIACISTLCIPALLNRADHSVRIETLLLKTTCWYLQQKARAINAPLTLKINSTAGSYTFDNQTHVLAPQVKFNRPAPTINQTDSQHASSTPVTFSDNTIIFYPQGTQNSGSIYLADQQGKAHYALTIAVAGAPYVRMYHLERNRWQLCA